jgi:UDP-galactopyranose mutase
MKTVTKTIQVTDIDTLPSNRISYFTDTFNHMSNDGFTPAEIIDYMVREAMLEAQLQREFPQYISSDVEELTHNTFKVQLEYFI